MNHKLILFGIFYCFLSVPVSGQINNIIFLGGNGDGSVSVLFKLKSNNAVFAGGNGHGDQSACYITLANNLIFSGAEGDGNASTCFTLISNNSIFAGGNADGNSAYCFLEMPNNMIFAGSNGDGNGSLCFSSLSNNPIFVGGLGDGALSMCFLDISNNPIFAGGEGDGYNLGEFLIQPPTIVWHGQISSDWHNPGNWDQNRVPTINDLAIIRTEVHDPFIVAGWFGIGDQTAPISECAQHVYILNGSEIVLDQTTRANVQQDMYVYGSLISLNSVIEPVMHLYNGGKITIFNQGIVQLTSQ